MNTLESMRIFMRVSETSSFTRAAESLGLPKATVSNSIQQLESNIGTRLLHRTTRKVQMTQDGLRFLERCKDLVADVEEVESMFLQSAHLSGRIRVDMSSGIARQVVVPKLPEFLAEYPNVEIELSSTDRKVDLIREGFDCVIRVGSLVDSGLIAKKLGHFTLVNCVSEGYLKKYGRPKKIEDLSEHRLIHYVSTLGMKSEGFDYFDGKNTVNVDMPGSVTVNNAEAYTAACLAGLGIIQVPLAPVRSYLQEGSLVEILPKHRSQPMPITLLYPHRRNLARRVHVFMNWIEKIMAGYAE